MKFDMNMVMSMLSKMDKKDLEAGIEQANKILQNKKAEDIIKDLNK
ncbi:MAG: hypothetical protein FWC68_03015 [Oscillospiraceae bacterium]|nr:hypothetical protein [Oscillospiraceae bacterium]